MNRRAGKTLVEVQDVHKKFLHEGREVEILKGIDLVIEEGEMLAVVGASGAGKSTLLHILGTLDLPSSGRILYQGENVTAYSAARLADFRNHRLGFVFQFHHLLPEFTALENVMMPGMIRGTGAGKLKKRARELLDEVGLTHRLSHRPGELSGGEQQRVALARALIMDPKLILADEPTGNLDSKTSEAIHALFFELNRSRGTTFLLVTHSRDLAERMPRKVTMRDGRIEQDTRRVPADGPFRGPGHAGHTDLGEAAAEERAPDRAEPAGEEEHLEDAPLEGRETSDEPDLDDAEEPSAGQASEEEDGERVSGPGDLDEEAEPAAVARDA